MKNRIFISSTCYDLLDLRDELFHFFKAYNVISRFSDHPLSEFEVYPDRNSLETCIRNVQLSDIFIIILSQRYGPTLQDLGYDCISATHLEYREAKKNNMPIYMYVRDRLDAECSIYDSNPTFKLKWISEKDKGIFNLIDEHRKLSIVNNNNWYWTFKSSYELKQIIKSDLKDLFKEQLLQELIRSGNASLIIPKHIKIEKFSSINYKLSLEFCNYGKSHVLNLIVWLEIDGGLREIKKMPIVIMGEKVLFECAVNLHNYSNAQLKFEYDDLSGLRIIDKVGIFWGNTLKDIHWSFEGKEIVFN